MKRLFIYGASGHGLVVADIARACGYEDIRFIDDGDNAYPAFSQIENEKEIPVALGVGINKTRKKLFDKVLDHGFCVATLIHPSAIISPSVTIGEGSVVMPNVVVNAFASIGKGSILNTSCVIEHENRIGDFVHISPGAMLAGDVSVGEGAHVGIGVSVKQGMRIGNYVLIGAGSVVVKDIHEYEMGYGNPYEQRGQNE